ncbi:MULTISPECIES: TetR/AcrR family transcriptional regulator [unclassified Rhodococcus (in: high G+C Gram-positive bacteria)]|uniref:TetR/AcrR family transcriptional regulator n=1 Tax=unclassified Rhodococcus (in: high G+C Gram-positive bacteria) TaxID=192944 RepID=UPI001469A278|nr:MULTISPECIES: TetR/AcrR family transcriptional regulator [unclassified Rhodococcus (in: high G+C Gram-positive bacteria)]MBF0663388.1 WHG domain-containing protein [Rhodococcus sp. (in: high G+C Gram-positive bacteria)]NMD95648.1 TetR/AcrR family transcriptional regulator [Rhodococcus sp. BL-253-APC-6A1W]NME79644.1 TetR/AcrR family transcriptional regulator [Rhodococcus sp. 105337]
MADIVAIGREHLAAGGAEALSLRAVARDLGVVSSAVYRYVASRDELLTLLVIDAYDELGDAVDAAVDAVDAADHRARFFALGRAVRAWARAEPARYGLIFGTPVPGYHAPAERTTQPGTRVVLTLVRILVEAHRAAALDEATEVPTTAGLVGDLDRIRAEISADLPDDVLARGLFVWPALFGAVSFEVFGQYGTDTFTDPESLFDHHLALLARTAGFRPTSR